MTEKKTKARALILEQEEKEKVLEVYRIADGSFEIETDNNLDEVYRILCDIKNQIESIRLMELLKGALNATHDS